MIIFIPKEVIKGYKRMDDRYEECWFKQYNSEKDGIRIVFGQNSERVACYAGTEWIIP